MEIACPQCSMKYALDPRLLPPGGVPVQCTRCSHVFIAGALEPAPAPRAAPPARPSQALNSTVLYGTSGKPAAGASPLSTQAFGAVPQIPQVAPVVPRVQPAAPVVAPAASAASQVHKTQAFGAVPQIPPAVRPATAKPAARPATAKPATAKPAAAKPASPISTQTPAVAPGDAASALKTTQVFGAVPPLGAAAAPRPSPASPSASGPASAPASPPAPRPAAPRAAPTPASAQPPGQASPASSERLMPWEPLTTLPYPSPAAAPPGMVPRSATPERPSREGEPVPAAARPEPLIGVAATTPIELPDEILNQLDRPLSELMGSEEPDVPVPAPPPAPPPGGATLNKPLELPPELMNRPPIQARDTRPKKSRAGQGLLIAGGVLVLALMALFTSPAWRSRGDVLPHPVQAARDGAVAKLRRDDAVSQQDAIAELKSLSAAHPQSVELLAELGIALALHLDDTQVRLATVRAREKGLGDVIARLTSTQTPLDWQSRVNTRKEELTALQQRGFDMDESVKSLSADTVQVLKRLEVIPEKEPPVAALARLRARAMMNGTLGSASTPGLAVKLAQAEQRDWSALAMAEYTLHQASPGGTQSLDAATSMEQMRAKNSTYLRAYVLGARLGVLRHEPASAQALLDTVITLNPKHELAHELLAYLQELRDRAAEPPPPPVRPAPAPTPEATPPVTAPVTPEGTPTPAPTSSPEAAPPSSPPVSPPPQGASAATPGPEGTSAPGRPGG